MPRSDLNRRLEVLNNARTAYLKASGVIPAPVYIVLSDRKAVCVACVEKIAVGEEIGFLPNPWRREGSLPAHAECVLIAYETKLGVKRDDL